MESIDKVVDSFRKMKNGTVVFEVEQEGKVHFFILDNSGTGFKTCIDLKTLENSDGEEDKLVSSLDYSPLEPEDVEFFKLGKKVYTLKDQGTVVTLKKYINKITG